VGDELQERVGEVDDDVSAADAAAVEREAFDAAQRKGWDKDLEDDA
jgi:hypothetical protein